MSDGYSPDATEEQKAVAQDLLDKIVDKNVKDTVIYSRYSETSDRYDMAMVVCNYNGPKETAAVVAEYFQRNREDVRLLDVAAGTGLCAVELRKYGFLKMDALDASPGMLEEAKAKGLYDQYITDILGENTLDISTDTYDAVVMCGFSTEILQRLPMTAFEELIRIVKPGGYFINTGRKTMYTHDDGKAEQLKRQLKTLEANGKWKRVKMKHFKNYLKGADGAVSVHMICK
ncbi:methyltransferase-like protein 27 [Haliotis asinina]|uniref:methyltransferase-like protein 27 n=1 Tax=Haliotis asinina TaxID=109174 RepID=UPI003531D016